MIHTFKSCGISAAIDSHNGCIYQLDSLMYSMLPYLPPISEMTRDLPTSVRYAFAKYDSLDLTDAYRKLYDIYTSEEKMPDTENSINKYIVTPDKSESNEFFKKIPAGSTVYMYVDTPEEASKAKSDFPYLKFAFAADVSVCEKIDDAVAVFKFSNSAELIETVDELFKRDIKKVAGYPADEISEAEASEAYDKLCRELVRMHKKGENGIFVPFTFDEATDNTSVISDGKAIECGKGTFSRVYIERGQMPFNTVFLNSDTLIDKCAECAVVLTVK